MRVYDGYVFRLDQHLARLYSCASILGLTLGISASEIEKAIYRLLQANDLYNARIRLTVSGGQGEMAPDISSCKSPTVLIACRSYSSQTQLHSYRAQVSTIKRNTHSVISSVKSLNYLDSLLAKREAKQAGFDEAIILNNKGFVAECSTSNIFIITKGNLITPSIGEGILPGITRAVVLELAASLQIKAMELRISLGQLLDSDEAFITNSIMGISPLTQVNDHIIGLGTPGKLTASFAQAYADIVNREKDEARIKE